MFRVWRNFFSALFVLMTVLIMRWDYDKLCYELGVNVP